MNDDKWCKLVEDDGCYVCSRCGFKLPACVSFVRLCGTRKQRLKVIREQARTRQFSRKLLGDRIEDALTFVGITKERVEKWVGGPCGCSERQERLNRLDAWVRGMFSGQSERAKKELEHLLENDCDSPS